jgi:hypothetical protein
MKNFINHLNVAVGIIAGICSIILFCKELFFEKTTGTAVADSLISVTKDIPNPSRTETTTEDDTPTNKQSPAITGKRPPLDTTTNLRDKNIKPDTSVAKKYISADSTASKGIQHGPTLNRSISSPEEKADFFVTLIKTPLVFYALVFGLIGCFFVAIFEFFQNVFTSFKHGFQTTWDIWNWAWNDVTLAWYWNNGVGWHLAVSILLWSIILIVSNREN